MRSSGCRSSTIRNIKRGLNQKRKIFNDEPQGIQGIAINTRREPYNDVRVRKALRHLFNRELMIQKLAFNEYVPLDSMFPFSVYENPNNEKIKYDPQLALQLLAEAGWKDRDAARTPDAATAQALTLELVYGNSGLRTVTSRSTRKTCARSASLSTSGTSRGKRLSSCSTTKRSRWRISATPASRSPVPDAASHSVMADQKNTNNITGFKNKRADEIMEVYEKEFDLENRVQAASRVRRHLHNTSITIFSEWSAPYQRLLFWNKFGYPQGSSPGRATTGMCQPSGGSIRTKSQQARRGYAVIRRSISARDPATTTTGLSSASADVASGAAVTSYFLRRLLLIIPTFIGITLVVFVIMHFVPGGPVERQIMRYKMATMEGGGGGRQLSVQLPESAIEEIRRYYGFDKPVHVRYIEWLRQRRRGWISATRTSTRSRSGTSSSPGFRFRSSWA